MKFLFAIFVLFAAAYAKTNLEIVEEIYSRILEIYYLAESKYNELPNPEEQLRVLNAHSTLRLSQHLKNVFANIQDEVLKENCDSNKQCYGSEAYKKGVIRVCLHANNYISNQIELYDNFTACSDKHVTNFIKHVIWVEANYRELRNIKQRLEEEYRDEANRAELLGVLDYYSKFVSDAQENLFDSAQKLQALYEELGSSLNSCAKNGYPRITKAYFDFESVQNCIEDLLRNVKRLDLPFVK